MRMLRTASVGCIALATGNVKYLYDYSKRVAKGEEISSFVYKYQINIFDRAFDDRKALPNYQKMKQGLLEANFELKTCPGNQFFLIRRTKSTKEALSMLSHRCLKTLTCFQYRHLLN